MMTCYLRDTNKFLRYRTLRTSILKSRFPTEGIELTRLVLFSATRYFGLDHFSRYGTKFEKYKWKYGVRNFSVVGYVGETLHTFSAQGFFLYLLATGKFRKERRIQISQRGVHSESIEAIRGSCATSSSRQGVPAY